MLFIYVSNEEHVMVTIETVSWMMQKLSIRTILQNRIINTPTDFQARNIVQPGSNITNNIPQGDFVVQNTFGVVNITSGNEIILKDGTLLSPSNSAVESFHRTLSHCFQLVDFHHKTKRIQQSKMKKISN